MAKFQNGAKSLGVGNVVSISRIQNTNLWISYFLKREKIIKNQGVEGVH